MAQRNVRNTRAVYGRRPNQSPKRTRKLPAPGNFKPFIKWIVALVVIILVWRAFSIDKIEISGNRAVPTTALMTAIDASFGRHPFSRNLLTLGLDPLDKDLLQDQHLKSVNVDRHWPTTLKVTVIERQFALIWKSGSQAYLIDDDGVAVQAGQGNERLPSITDTTGLPVTVGQSVAPARFIRFTTDVAGQLQARTKLAVSEMSVPESTSELYVKTSAGFIIKFDTTSGVEEQLTALTQVLQALSKLHKTPTQYIDLRIPNKAYYL